MMLKFIKRCLYSKLLRDKFIKKSIGDQDKSKIEKLIFDVDGSPYRIQVWTVYGLGESSPFDTVIDTVKNESMQDGSSILIKDSNKNTLVQITPNSYNREFTKDELATMRQDIVVSIEKISDECEASKWQYYDTTIRSFGKLLIRTPAMCLASFGLGLTAASVIAPCDVQSSVIIAAIGLAIGVVGALIYGIRDMQTIGNAKNLYLEH